MSSAGHYYARMELTLVRTNQPFTDVAISPEAATSRLDEVHHGSKNAWFRPSDTAVCCPRAQW